MNVAKLTPRIREILQSSDLSTVSAKKVRRQLENEMGESLDVYKTEIDDVIKRQFQVLHNESQQRHHAQQQYVQQYSQQGQIGGVYGGPQGLQVPGGGFPGSIHHAAPGIAAGGVAADGASPDATPRKRGRPRKPENERKQQRKKREVDPNRPKRQTGLSKPMKLSSELGELLGHKYCARTDVVKELWIYIKANGLQDQSDKRYILCDDKLLKIFQTERLFMYTMNKLLNDHLFKPTPEENAEAIALLNLPPTHPAVTSSAKAFAAVASGSADPGSATPAASDAPHSADSGDDDADDAEGDDADDGDAHSDKSAATDQQKSIGQPSPSLPTAAPLVLPPQSSSVNGDSSAT
ncbi:hypothetical protein LPJ61_005997 [Coemansia biformis]|uniref:SWIB-domain-containing protein n=1 Tax=Coemansia biformis TaxID=1286918 RepID=A0A9W7Y0I3_9FUNG|nr:hypothetical protein LPJ61_005997 [Coemansia biformis]